MTTLPERLQDFADDYPVTCDLDRKAVALLREAATALQSGGEVVAYWVPNARVMSDGSYEDGPGDLVLAQDATDKERQYGAPLCVASPAQPSGFVLVPVEPTAEMLRAGGCVEPPDSQWQNYIEAKGARLCWALMLTAAPAPIEQEG